MNETTTQISGPSATSIMKLDRLVSLDLFRGLTMFLLLAEGAGLYEAFDIFLPEGTFGHGIVRQFHHHPWNGLRFWDLIQPFFMFIVGVAMWFSVHKRIARGDSWRGISLHIYRRCLILLAFGVTLHIGYNNKLVWELWNVLSQLSVTILIAFLIMRMPIRTQLVISFGLILLTELLYRYTNIPGYDQPFVKDYNFGSYMDMVLMGKINPGGGWVAINCIPTTAHTIWGVLAGSLLAHGAKLSREKIRLLLIAGAIGLVVGYGLDWTGITPIIKRICTSSFVIVSGGWCLIALALTYWLIDVRNLKKGYGLFLIVGMNPIFVYVFMETIGKQWFNDFYYIFIRDSLGAWGVGDGIVAVLSAAITLAWVCYLAYWLYGKKIFIKV